MSHPFPSLDPVSLFLFGKAAPSLHFFAGRPFLPCTAHTATTTTTTTTITTTSLSLQCVTCMSHHRPMGSRRQFPRLVFLLLLLVEIAGSRSLRRNGERQKVKAWSHLGTSYETSDPYYDVGSPFSMPPYGDAMAPASSSAQDYPPFCIYPPLTPLPPTIIPYVPSPPPPPESTNPPEIPVPNPPVYVPGPPETVPSPPEAIPSPSPPAYEPNPPSTVPSPTGFVPSPPLPPPSFAIPGTPGFLPSPPPPSYIVPGTPELVPSPPPQPVYVFPTPPGLVPSPPGLVPSPPEFVPGPPIFLPPVVYPSPVALPPPIGAEWCVAKPTVPDPIIQEAMNYACGSGADCDSIQPGGPCYEPNTVIGHASFAFNSYFQRTRVAGGTCDFGATAMLVTKDPSYDGCRFIIF